MSNVVPEMHRCDEFPYCIWYPDVLDENTYRELVARYPQIKYHVDRACAVAGYTGLYRELDLLPETLTVDSTSTGSEPGYLNGDTAVRSSLGIKRKYSQGVLPLRTPDSHFNIKEDYCLDFVDFEPEAVTAARWLAVKYLYSPLPIDVPPLRKDLLILVAAYNGDIDRYSRLRRPDFLPKEQSCVIRGIYHNTFFAKWWSIRLNQEREEFAHTKIESAVMARAIMNNDLSRVTSVSRHMPYCIWYPTVPGEETLELLVHRRPDMAHQVARACIVGDYEELYNKLDPAPDSALLAEAKASANTYYVKDLEIKAAAAKEDGDDGSRLAMPDNGNGWKLYTKNDASKSHANTLRRSVGPENIVTDFAGLYDGIQADISRIELFVSAAKRDPADGPGDSSTAFGGSIDQELAKKGLADMSVEYREELERVTGQGSAEGSELS